MNNPVHTKFLDFIPSIIESKNGLLKNYQKKEIIFNEGEAEYNFYILLEGIVMMYRKASNGQKRILQFFGPQEVFGNITLVDYEHTMTAEALEPSNILQIKKSYMKQLVNQNPDLFWYLYKDLAKKLRHTSQIIENSYQTAKSRILIGLVQLSQQFGYKTEKGIMLNLNLTQEDLAQFTGTTRVTVAKLIGELTKDQILSTKPKPWVILQMDQLIRLSEYNTRNA